MISVSDLCALSSISGIEVLSASDAADGRAVREVAIMDDEPLTGAYDVFHSGDAVFSTLSFTGGDGSRMDEALMRLFERDVACVFVKGSLPYEPAAEVREESGRLGIPLVRYREGLLEQIISEARELIAEDARADRVEGALRGLMERRDGAEVGRLLQEITGLAGPRVQVVAFSAAEGDSLVVSALRGQVASALARTAPCFVARFSGGVIAFVSQEGSQAGLDRPQVEAVVAGFGSRPSAGCSEVLPSEEADVAMREALGCLSVAQRGGDTAVLWSQAGPASFHVARACDPLLARACEAGLRRLRASDEQTGGNLVESMEAYVACGGDTAAAAERLVQHPNSMRNRLNRARAVLGMEDASDKEFFAYLAMLYL